MADDVTEVEIKGVTYAVPTSILTVAVATFDQQYRRGIDVRSLARGIANELMPATRLDPYSCERLARCILSIKSKKRHQTARKATRKTNSTNQGTLFKV